VARPRLLFADEPTSGLDGQSAYTIVTFLRKLADAGQSVLVTIHQPSASLFAVFDSLLLLKAGGKTVFFGDTATMPEYFAAHGIPFPRDVNPAEYMIDVVSGEVSRERDWSEVWLNSEQHRFVVKELERLKLVNKRVESSNRDDGYGERDTDILTLFLQRSADPGHHLIIRVRRINDDPTQTGPVPRLHANLSTSRLRREQDRLAYQHRSVEWFLLVDDCE
jgi:ABC-type multidrug transport system ATPase subunit